MSNPVQLSRRPEQKRPFSDLLAETLRRLDMSPSELSRRAELSRNHVSQLLRQDNPVSLSPDVALKIAAATGLDAEHIVKVDAAYRTAQARLAPQPTLAEEIEWAESFPWRELASRQLIDATSGGIRLVLAMREFFGVASKSAWDDVWATKSLEYRRGHDAQGDDRAIRTWLRIGEINAQAIATEPFDKQGVAALLPELRSLTRESIGDAWLRARTLLASKGVALVMVEEFPSLTKINGATNWVSKDKVVVTLSSRMKRDDILWFNLFHELGHVLHDGKRTIHANNLIKHQSEPKAEEAANRFASKTLIPRDVKSELFDMTGRAQMARLADRLGIGEAIVVGQYLHMHGNRASLHKRMNSSLLRYRPVTRDGLTVPVAK